MAEADDLYARVRATYPSLTNEQCVELVRKVAGITEGVRDWRRGSNVSERLPVGTPLATFLDRQGRPSTLYDGGQGVGISGNNTTHAALLAGYTKDGILVAEQYVGSGGPHLHEYKFNDPRGGEHAAENYYSINTAEGLPAGERNPLKEPAGEASAYGYGIGAAAAKPQPAAAAATPSGHLHAGMLARRAAIGRGIGRRPSPAFGPSPGAGVTPMARGGSGGFAAASDPGSADQGPSASAVGQSVLSLRYRSRAVVRIV